MNTTYIAATLVVVAGPAHAQGIALKPIGEARLRYESVEQDGITREADAVTARLRAGFELSRNDWSLLAESEATLAIDEGYHSGVNRKTQFPIIADPENIELNRLQLQYRGIPKTLVTLGRQRINLDDQRFVGSVGWRQNEQTFDAVRLEYGGVKNLKIDLTYAWSDRTIWGVDGGRFGTAARLRAIGGDNVFANAAYKTPIGTLTGFAYLIDQDEPGVFANSSQTYGVRFAGTRPLSKTVSLSYAASYALQSDYHRNPNHYSADYYLVEGGIDAHGFKLGAGYEVLGADSGVALTSFQTPLATLHKFQGWADKFLATPPNGIRDLYGSAGYAKKGVLGLDLVSTSVAYHRYDSDRLDLDYGDEWNVLISAKRGRWTLTAKYADYRAQRFATDTRKAWMQIEWAL